MPKAGGKSWINMMGIGLATVILQAGALKEPLEMNLSPEGVSFHIEAADEGSIDRLTVTPEGLKEQSRPVTMDIEGSVSGMEVAYLNRDGSPELYIFVSSAGSGSYGRLVAFSVNRMRSMSGIHLPKLDLNSAEARGYMGHDRFSIEKAHLVRTFPIYEKDGPNCCPSGGIRKLYYRLLPGEATWQLRLVRSETLTSKNTKIKQRSDSNDENDLHIHSHKAFHSLCRPHRLQYHKANHG